MTSGLSFVNLCPQCKKRKIRKLVFISLDFGFCTKTYICWRLYTVYTLIRIRCHRLHPGEWMLLLGSYIESEMDNFFFVNKSLKPVVLYCIHGHDGCPYNINGNLKPCKTLSIVKDIFKRIHPYRTDAVHPFLTDASSCWSRTGHIKVNRPCPWVVV